MISFQSSLILINKLMTNMGNIIKFFDSPYTDELSDDDDDYYDFEEDIPQKRNVADVNPTRDPFTTDAAPRLPVTLPQPESTLNLDKINEIESALDEDEIVSLVYLLFEDNHYALQELRLRLQDSSRRLLQEWARREEKAKNSWTKKIIEALCIIQNFKILRKLGYKKQDTIDHYLPHQPNVCLHVNKMRKICYILCEKMNNQKTQRFLNLLKKDVSQFGRNISNLDYDYLEMYFLELEIDRYINRLSLANLKKVLKVMDDDELYNVIEENMLCINNTDANNTEPKVQQVKIFEDNTPSIAGGLESLLSSSSFGLIPSGNSSMSSMTLNPRKTSTSLDNNRVARTDFISEPEEISSPAKNQIPGVEKYPIDPMNPGVVLIINQQEFFTEFEPKYKHLLPKDMTNKLDQRTGTEKDRDDLISTFKRFGFKVIVRENLIHLDMLTEIKDVLSNVTNQSSLFICILSHGDKGIVYGSNSCRVKVSKIQRLMCKTNKKNLKGKPKILILQSCQGQQCQKINVNSSNDDSDSSDSDSDDLTTDNAAGRQPLPKTADMFTFWATIPGYAAVRHKKTGSWFIQAFCKQMVDLGNVVHFADICTGVINEVTQKKWITPDGNNVTTPMVVNTLTKSFYLPSMKS